MTTSSNPLLIVDDNADNRDLLSLYLEDADYRVECASGGEEALEKIATRKFDLVLLDIMMRGMSGIEVLRKLRKRYPLSELPVIMVTGRQDREMVVDAFELGANDYITKPLEVEVMLARVSTHITLKHLFEHNQEFLGIASHDLRKPLQLTRDVIESLQEDYPAGVAEVDTRDLQERLALMMMSVEYMQRLVSDYLDISTLTDEQIKHALRWLDLNALTERVVKSNLAYARSKRHTLELDLAAELPEIRADENRLMQLIDNLVGNAIKFSPPGTSTQIRTRRDHRGLVCEVQDGGPGLPSEELEKAFNLERALLSNQPTGGEKSTGLGLAICKRIVDLHGGEIGVRNNQPPPGATFWFRLPL